MMHNNNMVARAPPRGRRFQRLMATGTVLGALWLNAINLEMDSSTKIAFVWLPLGACALFALYLFLKLVLGVSSFSSRPDEANALQNDISMARADLSARGFKME